MPTYISIPLSQINEPENPARFQMDQEEYDALKESVAAKGVRQPISVFVVGDRYGIEDGHRRFLVSRDLRLAEIPALIFAEDERQPESDKLHLNQFHSKLSPAEEAMFYAELMEKQGYTYEQLLGVVKHSDGYVSDRLALLRGDQEVFRALAEKQIKFGVARELNRIPDEKLRHFYLHYAITTGCTARLAAQWVEQAKLNAGQVAAPPVDGAATTVSTVGVVEPPHCWWCGGNRDPYALIFSQIHPWCRDRLIATRDKGE